MSSITSGSDSTTSTIPLPPLRLRNTKVQDAQGADSGTFQTVIPDVVDTALYWLTNDFTDEDDVKCAVADRRVWQYRHIFDHFTVKEEDYRHLKAKSPLYHKTLNKYRTVFQDIRAKMEVILTEGRSDEVYAFIDEDRDQGSSPCIQITMGLLKLFHDATSLEQHHVLWYALDVVSHHLGLILGRYLYGQGFSIPVDEAKHDKEEEQVHLDIFDRHQLRFSTEASLKDLVGLRLMRPGPRPVLGDEFVQELNDLFYNGAQCLPPLAINLGEQNFLEAESLIQLNFPQTEAVPFEAFSTYPLSGIPVSSSTSTTPEGITEENVPSLVERSRAWAKARRDAISSKRPAISYNMCGTHDFDYEMWINRAPKLVINRVVPSSS